MKPTTQTKVDVIRAFREQRFNDGLNLLRKEQEKHEKRSKAIDKKLAAKKKNKAKKKTAKR